MMPRCIDRSMHDSPAIALAKKELRGRMRAVVRAMSDSQRCAASEAACERIARLPAFASAHTIMLYLPLSAEADCTALLQQCLKEGRHVCVPLVDWSACRMEPVSLTSLEDGALIMDEHRVRVPRDSQPVSANSIDVVIVPGLAFDASCRRLGRAGGFYDRFLARLPSATTTIGLAFEAQIVEDLPVASHDMGVHMVATEQRLIEARSIS